MIPNPPNPDASLPGPSPSGANPPLPAVPFFACPACGQALSASATSWACPVGHTFDIAREGYVNLLLAHHRHSAAPGDNPDMVRARRAFLSAGHYRPLMDAAADLLAHSGAETLLDIGCGEGSYTRAFARAIPAAAGLDISKFAVQLAAKAFRPLPFVVGNAARLPVLEGAVDLATVFFTRVPAPELRRILRPGGRVLLATPGADHLLSLRARLYDEVRPYDPEKAAVGLTPGFSVLEVREVGFDLSLAAAALRQLLTMTPYAWKARPGRREALEEAGLLETRAAFRLTLLRREESPA